MKFYLLNKVFLEGMFGVNRVIDPKCSKINM